MKPPVSFGPVFIHAVLAVAFGVAGAPAQSSPPPPTPPPTLVPTAVIRVSGGIVNLQSQTPISGAQIAILGTPFVTTSDSAGRFTYAGVGAGTYLLQARAIGYESRRWIIRLDAGDSVHYVLEMPPIGLDLATIVVEASPTRFALRMMEFEQRRAAKRGIFLTGAEIATKKSSTLVDLLRGVPGVRVSCRSGTCVVEMMRSARGVCRADWVVDGFPATQSGTPHLPTVGIVGIEVYRSPNETPPEFLKSDSQCGVIVIWTRAGP